MALIGVRCLMILIAAVVSDYVPRMLRLPARVGVLGLSCVMFAGLMKTSLTGPGIGGELNKITCAVISTASLQRF